MKTKVLLLVIIFSCQFVNSQQRTCASTEKMNEMMFNPLMKAKYLEQIEKSNQELLRLENNPQARNPQATLRIPVAVHFPLASNANRSCLIALAQNQLDILNDDFNATNSDLSIWNNTTGSYFSGVNVGTIDVQFVLATQNHPVGTDPNLVNGQPAVTIGYDYGFGSDWDANWAGYFNIVVKSLTGGTLGYAYPASNPNSGAAVFIRSSAFGSGSGCPSFLPTAPYNLGRTLTHEVGHYFNLNHIWGDAFCGNDLVADTPQHDEDNGGCPEIDHFSACAGERELTMNYMDYTYDVCMYMFTQGQTTRMQAHFNSVYSNFNQNTLSSDTFLVNPTFSVYPNPNNGDFSIDFDQNGIDNSVIVYDVTGRKVYENNFQNVTSTVTINMNGTTKGIYSIVVSNEEGTSSRKMIIK